MVSCVISQLLVICIYAYIIYLYNLVICRVYWLVFFNIYSMRSRPLLGGVPGYLGLPWGWHVAYQWSSLSSRRTLQPGRRHTVYVFFRQRTFLKIVQMINSNFV